MRSSSERVLLATSSFGAIDSTPVQRLEAAGLVPVSNPYGRRLTRDEVVSLLAPDVIGLIAGLEPLDRGVLEGSSLEAICRVGSGMSNVDLGAARELGIAVHNTPDAPTNAVAELTLGALLALLRQIPAMNRALHEGRWDRRIGGQIDGKTALVVGYGRIGRRVGQLLTAFGGEVLAVDPEVDPDQAEVPLVSLHEGLEIANIVCVHASGELCLIGASELALLPDGAYVLNAGRGGLVSEQALHESLLNGRLAGAWLDVFEDEPYEGPLRDLGNALLTAHIGSYTAECRGRMETQAVDLLLEALGRTRASS